MNRIVLAAGWAAGTAALLASAPALAVDPTSTTDQFQVNLRVYHECTIDTNTLDFGATGLTNTDLDTSATITVDCTERSPYSIALDGGANSGGSTSARKLKNTDGDTISYQLYSDAGTASPWGDNIGTDTVDGTAAQASTSYTVHAHIPHFHNKPAGSYSDTVTATIWYGGAEAQ